MRLNRSYNFLRGGCLFCYRGIFSGLSNETVGAASYTYLAMDPAIQQMISTVNTFQQLLLRYVSLFIKNKLVAALIVEEVISEYCANARVIAPSDTRAFLHTCTLHKCLAWLAAKPVTLNLRKPKNPT